MAGFVSLPSGTFTSTGPPATGSPGGSYSYDAKLGKWLPVALSDISPDGTSYVTTTPIAPGAAPLGTG